MQHCLKRLGFSSRRNRQAQQQVVCQRVLAANELDRALRAKGRGTCENHRQP